MHFAIISKITYVLAAAKKNDFLSSQTPFITLRELYC